MSFEKARHLMEDMTVKEWRLAKVLEGVEDDTNWENCVPSLKACQGRRIIEKGTK